MEMFYELLRYLFRKWNIIYLKNEKKKDITSAVS